MGNGMHNARDVARVDEQNEELSIRRSACQGETSEKGWEAASNERRLPPGVAAASAAMSDRMVPIAEAAITAMVRVWAARPGRRAEEAGYFLERLAEAMLSPRERAARVNAEIIRRVG